MQDGTPLDLRRDYFTTLRDEIRATKARIFIIIMTGVLGAPLLGYVAQQTQSRLLMMLAPFLVLLLLVLYLSEQTVLMRAGRYIRDNVEAGDRDWERWVGGLKLRSAERQMFAMFIIVGLIFYALLLVEAVGFMLASDDTMDISYDAYFWRYGLPVLYGVATVWALITIARFWHSAVSTSAD